MRLLTVIILLFVSVITSNNRTDKQTNKPTNQPTNSPTNNNNNKEREREREREREFSFNGGCYISIDYLFSMQPSHAIIITLINTNKQASITTYTQ